MITSFKLKLIFKGTREADINVAEGKKRSRILASEAEKIEQVKLKNDQLNNN